MTEPTMTTHIERTLKNTMTTARKLSLFFAHLESGGKLEIDGRTYVWLDNHITREEMDDAGNMQYFGIDGLAIVCESENLATGEKSERYIGQQDMPLNLVVELVESLSEEQLFGITAGAALLRTVKMR